MLSPEHQALIPVGYDYETNKKQFLDGVQWSVMQFDREQYNEWFANKGEFAGRHLALITGKRSQNLVAIDVDSTALHVEQKKHLDGMDLPPTLTVPTPRGGRHMIYKAPFGYRVKTVADFFGDKTGIDIRGEGGLIVLYPDLVKGAKPDGGWWTRIGYEHYDFSQVAILPTVVARMLHDKPKAKHEHVVVPTGWVGGNIAKGSRDEQVRDILWKWVHRCTDYDVLWFALMGLNEAKIKPPLDKGRLQYMLTRALEKRSTDGLMPERSDASEWG